MEIEKDSLTGSSDIMIYLEGRYGIRNVRIKDLIRLKLAVFTFEKVKSQGKEEYFRWYPAKC